MKYRIFSIFTILFCAFFIHISVSAEENIEVYNRGEKVELLHGVLYHNDEYYFHINDLAQFGLEVTKDNYTYTITSYDFLGKERRWTIQAMTVINSAQLLNPPKTEDGRTIYTVMCNGNYTCRKSEEIGNSLGILKPVGSFGNDRTVIIRLDDDYYISVEFVGETISHSFSFEEGKMEFYFSDNNSVITTSTVNLTKNTTAPSGGFDVKIYTAYKIGDGESIEDFEILSATTCTVLENENSAKCEIETPADKITSKNIYYIADFGKEYDLIYKEYDFSVVGNISVNARRTYISYTLDISLPQIDEKDVSFTVFVDVEGESFSKTGTIKSGEISTTIEFVQLPVGEDYGSRIVFEYHKYKNSIIDDFGFFNPEYAKDRRKSFTAILSMAVLCNISLPDDFVCQGDVEITITLKKYLPSGSLVVVDKLNDWNGKETVVLNNDARSAQVYLYNHTNTSMLSYKVTGNIEGLCEKGFLNDDGTLSSEESNAGKIGESMSVDITLLRRKKVSVNIFRPFSVSQDEDIYANVYLFKVKDGISVGNLMDFTKTPLIPAGERKSLIELEVTEDVRYKLRITDITGQDDLFDYCYYVKDIASSVESSQLKEISYGDDSISMVLLTCNEITGTIKCEENLGFTVTAICELYNGREIQVNAVAKDGGFKLKIPEDVDKYKLSVETGIGKKNYYVADGVSTDNEAEASVLYNEDKSNILLEYIIFNPTLPVEIATSENSNYFYFKNIGERDIESYDAYIAYYDIDGRLILTEKNNVVQHQSGRVLNIRKNYDIYNENYKTKKIKAFAWETDSTNPLGKTFEIIVNTPETPEKNLSVFTSGDINAVINCENRILSRAPVEICDTLYISAVDFEKLGYTIYQENRFIYVEKNDLKFRFENDENTACLVEGNNIYDILEIDAPIMVEGTEVIVPVVVVSELFGETAGWYSEDKRVIINIPFYDIDYSSDLFEVALDMYLRGIVLGYEDKTLRPYREVTRSEAAVYFARTMGHDFENYEFECEDVAEDYWASSWIGIRINEGVFGLEQNKFRPGDMITVKETIIAALKMKGKYSENYLEAAENYGMIQNINVEDIDRNITLAELLQILFVA